MSTVKSLSVGEGDMFYIKHGSDSFTIIDCCMAEDQRSRILSELKEQSAAKGIKRFISTHPDDDHIMGLAYLFNKMSIPNFYCVKNEVTKEDKTEDFQRYSEIRDDTDRAFHLFSGCSRKWLNQESDERGSAGIKTLWPITSNKRYKEALSAAKDGESPNNISPILKYSLTGGANILWMGDMEKDFMEEIKDEVKIGPVDVLFAPHHGRDSGKVPADWLQMMKPKIIVIGEAPSELLNYYEAYNTITQNSAGDITFECVDKRVHTYVSDPEYTVNFLNDENMPHTDHGYYIGTLKLEQ